MQALCSVFIGTPKLLLHCNNTGLLSDVLHPYSPYSPTPPPFVPELYQKVLISLRDMLETEEVLCHAVVSTISNITDEP